nr:putative capsid protein [Crucivirus sp.]
MIFFPSYLNSHMPRRKLRRAIRKVTGLGTFRRQSKYKSARRRVVRGGGTYRRATVRGRGSYWSDFKDTLASLKPFESLGTALGAKYGGAPGGAVGGKLGSWLGKITGLGDYKVNSNSLLGLATKGTSSGSVPVIENFTGGTIITHREYIMDINSTEDFKNISFEINPGIRRTFPWLADIAACYQQWKPLGILFCFESHSSDALNSTNTALGSLIISSNYEADAPDFKSQQEALNTEYTTSTKPSLSVIHPLECSPRENPQRIFYVRSSALDPLSNSSQLWYDLCKTQFITLGSQAVANVGKLYVTYQIEFTKPLLGGSSSGQTVQYAHYQISSQTNSFPFGANGNPTKVVDNIGLTVTSEDEMGIGVIQFPDGDPSSMYKIDVSWYGGATGASLSVPNIEGFDMSYLNIFEENSSSYLPLSGTFPAGTTCMQTSLGVVRGPVGAVSTVNYHPGVFPLGNGGDIFVSRIHPSYSPPPTPDPLITMDSYEKELRAFLSDRKNKGLSDEAKLMLFDRLHGRSLSIKEPETPPPERMDLSQSMAEDISTLSSRLSKLVVRK